MKNEVGDAGRGESYSHQGAAKPLSSSTYLLVGLMKKMLASKVGSRLRDSNASIPHGEKDKASKWESASYTRIHNPKAFKAL